MTPALERRLLQLTIGLAALAPIYGGGLGALGHWQPGGHARYLSGLLLGIGLTFWWTIPTIERRGEIVRALAVIVVIGGLARLGAALQRGWPPETGFPLMMELAVTPLIALWRERVQRRLATTSR